MVAVMLVIAAAIITCELRNALAAAGDAAGPYAPAPAANRGGEPSGGRPRSPLTAH